VELVKLQGLVEYSKAKYEDLTPEPLVLPPRQSEHGYVRPPMSDQTFVPEIYTPENREEDEAY
jgi:hypothetical protein